MKLRELWTLLFVLQLLPQALTQTVHESNSTDLLFAKIFDIRYSMVNPPRVNGTFNVTFDMAIAQLLELTWYDTRLSWRNRVFNGNLSFNSVQSIKIPNSQIWKPDLVVYNEYAG
uniref:Neur_chan_LBD domain-containing protein n=1 Tax=Macrostomum lignano TaxID=282301 RepID=A0A1I8GCI8_9PLAT